MKIPKQELRKRFALKSWVGKNLELLEAVYDCDMILAFKENQQEIIKNQSKRSKNSVYVL